MYSSKAYLKNYFYWCFFAFLLMILTNIIIDPHRIFRILEIDNINDQKPVMGSGGLRKVKSIEIEKGDYDTIILGTSRAMEGLDPLSYLWPSKNVYNAALSKSNIYEISQVFQFSHQVQPIKSVILGLDFLSFSGDNRVDGDFNLSLFADKSKPEIYFKSLFSSQQLIRSWKTFQFNNKGNQLNVVYTPQGFRKTKSFAAFNQKIFRKNLQDNFNSYQRLDYQKSQLKAFEDIVSYCLENNIKLYLFISPIHVQNLEAMRIAGHFPTFEQWKKDLVNVVEKANSYVKSSDKVYLWDFTGYNSITTETIPNTNQKSTLKWYIDSAHYRPEVGNFIIELVVNGNRKETANIPQDFGVIINQNNIAQHLKNIRLNQQSYHENNPQVIEEIEQFFK
ncbi:MAG: hypothetical protein QNJ33_12385 [Crocosphaera sp.]|nr:hypothetical protein [Crocosphaera sp.]